MTFFKWSSSAGPYNADVSGEVPLTGCQLAAKSLRSSLLGQPLHIDVIVCALHLCHMVTSEHQSSPCHHLASARVIVSCQHLALARAIKRVVVSCQHLASARVIKRDLQDLRSNCP